MVTLQAIGLAIIQGITSFIPVDESAHKLLLSYFLDWPHAPQELDGALAMSSLLAVLVFFRHDWASILSSGLRSLIAWQKPMMLDERMPFFIFLTFVPALAAWTYAPNLPLEELKSPLWLAGLMIATCLPLWFSESMNRRLKSPSYWNWKDSLVLGLCQISFLIPGIGRQAGAIAAAYLLNYQKEAALKFTLLSFAPVLALQALSGLKNLSFQAPTPAPDLTWMSFWVASAVCFLASLFILNYVMKHGPTKSLAGVIVYRCGIGAAVLALYWFRTGH